MPGQANVSGADYIGFTLDHDAYVPGRRSCVWCVWSHHTGDLLGRIKWFGRWRQYAFYPDGLETCPGSPGRAVLA